MALTPRLELRQSQTLVMTPQLQQAIKLLQLTNLELTAYVDNEIERNPLLERDERDESDDDAPPAPEAAKPGEGDDPVLGAEYDNLWTSDGVGDQIGPAAAESWRGAGDSGGAAIDQAPAGAIGFREHVLNQLMVELTDPVDRVIGVHLADMLDDAGYLEGALEPVAERLGCGVARIEATLERLQRFEPTGVFARSLKECLALQLRERDRLDPAMQAMLDNLDLLAGQNLRELKRRCGVDDEDLDDMLAEIHALDPKPGLAFGGDATVAVMPDVYVRQSAGGGWTVELNNATLPRVLVNERYYARVSRGARSKGEKAYLSECLQSANWLARSLDQRANTILRVASELVRQQEAFLTHGVQHLRPLVLRNIAEAIEMHESTVSRVTANKYMATPRGFFEMRYFFTSAIPGRDGEAHSAEAVRDRIKRLIDAEDAARTRSDERLTEILKSEGIDIARRTVAKYREAMGIASSTRRRRAKAGPLR